MHRHLPHCAMSQPSTACCLGLRSSFGYGDRLGSATPGHLAAHLECGGAIEPIFAQQSIREMVRTRRSPTEVMQSAAAALEAARFTGRWGADADHLKTPADVDETAAAGFVFFTIDPSEFVDPAADHDSSQEIDRKFRQVQATAGWFERYAGQSRVLGGGLKIDFDRHSVQRAAVKYGRAIAHAISLAKHIDRVMSSLGRDYEIELSVDETPQPTSLAEHFIIAEQCLLSGMRLISLAPRYLGDFEKGIDYRGDRAAFARSLADHAAIAQCLGPYKLSLHSGSDKLSIYTDFARLTQGRFHVKTAGTSYLEALRVVARHDADLFREIVRFSRGRFETDRATYHISATLEASPPPEAVDGVGPLEAAYLNADNGRQILHVSFGSVLTDARLGPAIHALLASEPATHRELLRIHFGRHLAALLRGLPDSALHGQ